MLIKYSRIAKNVFYKLAGKQKVLHCIGDSHIQNFEYLSKANLLPQTDFHFCVVQGATNMGLANPHSQTKAMPIFLDYLTKIPRGEYAIFCLGEVDCGFVIWYRADKYGTPVREQFDLSLTNYFGLIETYLSHLAPENVIVCSVPLPTIPDHQLVKGEVANKRLSITATQKERTALTIEYNGRLHEYCKMHGIHYLDLQQETLDSRTGVVSREFLSCDPLDHHFEPEKIVQLITLKLNGVGFH
jgi:hypothetical protein